MSESDIGRQANTDLVGRFNQDEFSTENQSTQAKARGRLFFVDHLRVFLTILVVVHHLAVTYSELPLWYYTEAHSSAVTTGILSILLLINQGFFMGLFFLISAYFVPGSIARKGVGRFVKGRFLRLFVPLAAYYFVIGPATTLAVGVYQGSGFPSLGEYLDSLGFGPTWFLEALLLFTCLYALWRFLRRYQSVPDGARGHGPPTYRMIASFIAILATVTFLWRTVVPVGMLVPVIDFPTPAYLPQYVSLFVVGLIASRRDWFSNIPDSIGKAGFGMALGATMIFFPLTLITIPESMGNGNWQSIFYALWDSIFCVGIGLGLLTLFRKHFDRQRRLGKFLSTHAYAVYIIHPPVIVAVAIALTAVSLHPMFKFGLAVVVGVPLCFGAAYLVRKLPFASRIL